MLQVTQTMDNVKINLNMFDMIK